MSQNKTQNQIFKVKLMAWDKVSGDMIENSLVFVHADSLATEAKTLAKIWAKEEHIGQDKEIRISRDTECIFTPKPLVRWDNFRDAKVLESRKGKAWSMGNSGKRIKI